MSAGPDRLLTVAAPAAQQSKTNQHNGHGLSLRKRVTTGARARRSDPAHMCHLTMHQILI